MFEWSPSLGQRAIASAIRVIAVVAAVVAAVIAAVVAVAALLAVLRVVVFLLLTLLAYIGGVFDEDKLREKKRQDDRYLLHEKLIGECAGRGDNPITKNGEYVRCDPLKKR